MNNYCARYYQSASRIFVWPYQWQRTPNHRTWQTKIFATRLHEKRPTYHNLTNTGCFAKIITDAATSSTMKSRPNTIAKRIHCYTNGTKTEIIKMLLRSDFDHSAEENICNDTAGNCSVCRRSGAQLHERKYLFLMYVKHVTVKFKLAWCSWLFVRSNIVFYTSLKQESAVPRLRSQTNAQRSVWHFYWN